MQTIFENKATSASRRRAPEAVTTPGTERDQLVARLKRNRRIESELEVDVQAGVAAPEQLEAVRRERARLEEQIAGLDATASREAERLKQCTARGPALLAEAQTADSAIEAAVAQLEGALSNARAVVAEIERDFIVDTTYDGRSRLAAPFNVASVLGRIATALREFEAPLAAYRRATKE